MLLTRILAGLPALPGALCRGRGGRFDGDDPASIDTAVALCRACPCIEDCKAWVALQPQGTLCGVYAGKLHVHRFKTA